MITNTYHGRFNVHFLTPGQIQKELNIITGHLSQKLKLPIENSRHDLSNIYQLLNVRTRMKDLYLIFEIKIPLISRDEYDLYKMVSIPERNSDNMFYFMPISNYVAINLKRDTYVPISDLDLSKCLQYNPNTKLCHLKTPIYQFQSQESLCKKDPLTRRCKVQNSKCENQWTELEQANTYLYFCCEVCDARIVCEHQITAKRLTRAG